MIDVSQVSSLLQSLGVSGAAASKAAERAAGSSDAAGFLKQLQSSLAELAGEQKSPAGAASATSAASSNATKPAVQAPFESFEEFRAWEKGLGNTFAADYQTPDYVRAMGMCRMGGEAEAFGRYTFFKNHPECAIDYQAVRSGAPSQMPTDGSTLVKSDLSAMPTETASYYRKNPGALLMAEGFNMDPTLFKQRLDGKADIPTDANATEWLMQHQWTASGVVANDNRATLAQAPFRGLDGNGASTYRLARMDPGSGALVDLDGSRYDPRTGDAAV